MNPTDFARADIRALQPYASARALAISAGVLLNANENPWPPEGDEGLQLNRYPDPQPAQLKAQLAYYYMVASEQILITRGSDEGIDLLTRAYCRAGIDRVLTCPPCFGMYAMSARIQGAEVVEIPLLERDGAWHLDPASINKAPACRLYFLCSPNNPTGNLVPADQVLALADRVAGHGLVIIDEAYIEFCNQDSLAGAITDHPNLVVLRTLSKAFALAGCRIGALIADPRIIDLLRRIIAPYPLPTPSVAAALRALTANESRARQLNELAEQKRRLVTALEDQKGIRAIWPGEANFVLIRVDDGGALVRAAGEAGIRLRDQSAQPGLANCVRITIGTADETGILIDWMVDFSKGQRP